MTSFMTSAMTTALCSDEQQVSSCICDSLLVYSLLLATLLNCPNMAGSKGGWGESRGHSRSKVCSSCGPQMKFTTPIFWQKYMLLH